MGLVKEPKELDLSSKSEPWTEQELADFRVIMRDIKSKGAKSSNKLALSKYKKKQKA
jgi:hypothetical protein